MRATRRNKLGVLGFPLTESPADVQKAWKKEIERRMEEIRTGRAVMIPAEVAMRRARRMLARMSRRRLEAAAPLISTRLQPGVGGRRALSAASAASRVREKAVKTAGRPLGRRVTGLKPGANERKYLEVTEATYVAGYKLRLVFNDGKTRVMDFEPFLRQAQNPMTTQYRQLRKFKSFRLHYGDLMWGDYEMIFPIADLHEGKI